jgi:phage protein U
MGDENDSKTLEFFFDETFCDCQSELAKLQVAFATRLPLALVAGDGAFNGVRWLVESLDVTTLKTTPYGRPVRMKVVVSLIEAPLGNMFNFLASLARGAASAIRRSGNPSIGTRSK